MSKSDRAKLNEIFEQFYALLKEKKYFGEFFDRSCLDDDGVKLCSEKGWFNCQGAFDESVCKQKHIINPYSTKDARILFSTWNLDHQIEKSRTVLPSLIESLKNCPRGKDVNWKYFFELLFTLENLKLVDIRCHKKTAHTNRVVDSGRIYVEREQKANTSASTLQMDEIESQNESQNPNSSSSDEEWTPD